MEYEHRERPAQEIQAIRCSLLLVGWETMLAETAPFGKGLAWPKNEVRKFLVPKAQN